MKARLYKIFSGLLIAIFLSSMVLAGVVNATPQQNSQEQIPAAKREPKKGINPETGKVSFIGAGDPIHVPGVSDVKGLPPHERGLGMANAYGREFGLKNPAQELKLLKSERGANGKEIVRYQQLYRDVPVIAGEMIVNMNAQGELLSISGEVSSDLTLDTRPAIKAQEASRTALDEISGLYGVDARDLISTNPELWIFDESLLRASTRPVELVWRMEVSARDTLQPIREMVLVNAQTGEISLHIDQLHVADVHHPVAEGPRAATVTAASQIQYVDLLVDEARGKLYGADKVGNKIDVIDMADLSVTSSYLLVSGALPTGLDLSLDGNELAVAQSGLSRVKFINLIDDTISETSAALSGTNTKVTDVVYGRTGILYALSSNGLHVIDTTVLPHAEDAAQYIPDNSSSYSEGFGVLSSDKNTLFYVTGTCCSGYNSLYKVDVSSGLTKPVLSNQTYMYGSGYKTNIRLSLIDDNTLLTSLGSIYNTTTLVPVAKNGQILSPATAIPGRDFYVTSSDNSAGADVLYFFDNQSSYKVSSLSTSVIGVPGAVAVTSNGSSLFVSSTGGMARFDIGDTPPGTPVAPPASLKVYRDFAFDMSRGVVYGTDAANRVDVIDQSTGTVLNSFLLPNGSNPMGIDLSPDGNELAVALQGLETIYFMDAETGAEIARATPKIDLSIYYDNLPNDVIYGRAGRLYSNGNSKLQIFDTVTHTWLSRISVSSNGEMLLTADKKYLYDNGSFSNVYIYDVQTDNVTQVYQGPISVVSAPRFTMVPDGSKVFASSGQVWSGDMQEQLGTLEGGGGKLIKYIPGLNLVALTVSVGQGDVIKFFSPTTYRLLSTYTPRSTGIIVEMESAPDGSKLVFNVNNTIQILNLDPALPLSIVAQSGSGQSVQVSTPFLDPLKVKVQNIFGNPLPNLTVTFQGPASGASGVFEDTNTNTTTALTDANGIATSSMLTANNSVGSYTVKATVSTLTTSADFQLTNLAAITCTVITGSGNPGLFLPYKQHNCGKTADGVGSGDFNNDGRQDVALAIAGNVLIFLQDSNGNLSQPRAYAGISGYLAVGDLNHDGLDDVVTADTYYNTISVFIQKNDGTLAYRVTYATSTYPDAIAVGDINSDGLEDVVVSHWNSPVIGVFAQKPNGTLSAMISYPSVSAGYDDIAIGDVNNDGRNDVVKMNGQGYANPNLQVYLQNTNGSLGTAIPYTLGCNCLSSGVGIGDVTGDGRQDVIISHGGNKPTAFIAVFAQDINGNLQPAVSYAAYDIPEPVEVKDVNSDNLADVITLHSGWARAGVLLQQQNGNLASESLYVLPNSNSYYNPQDLSVGDVNNDGLPDLLIADYTGLVVLYRNTTIPPTPSPTPTYTPSSTPGPTFTPSPTFTPGPGPSPTPRPSSTTGPSPTPVPPSSSGSRRTYTASGGGSLPGTFLCDQNQASCTNGADFDADEAHQYAADTFVFYNTHHKRNSIDNAGGIITSTVNYGVNYRNAFWNGYQVVYGDDMAADDVVGHEITHGVTQYTSNLIYSYQSGAINESFSDVWGEFIDQTNGLGNDAVSVKWLMGEDSALSVIRSMSNPPAYGHPDKMSSPYFYTGSGDNGGVHINSGVNNKAAYLMVEGGTFNGRTILGIGLNKTAAVYYETQVYHLTMGANYNDLYYALIQACQNLVGGTDGITENDCNQVRLAAEAVEMIPAPPQTPTPSATYTATFTPTNTFTPTATPPYSYQPLYLSLAGSQTIGGISSSDEDILRFDGSTWSLLFDGSDVGVGSPDLFAFSILDSDTILMAFSASVTVQGIAATPQDVLRFDATSLGTTTAGTFSMYFDGSDVGFDTTAEKIDSVSLLPDGRVLLSTTGNPGVTGLSGLADEDVLAFTPTSLGDNTSGAWSLYFDGSDVGLSTSSGEDIDALDVTSNGNIYLSTLDNFSVTGVSGADEDVFVCTPTSLGSNTACTFSSSLYFDGSTWGLSANDVDAFNFLSLAPLPTSTPTRTPSQTPTVTRTPTRTPSPIATKTFTPTVTPLVTNTPPAPLTLTVNSLLDAVDVNPGNGICATESGDCTLRAAIQETNARPGADTIILPAGTYTLTLPGVFEEAAASGDLNITGDLTITGAGSNSTIIDGNGSILQDRVFYIMDAYTVNFADLTIRGGNPNPNNGGGIRNWGGTLTLRRVVLRDNTAGSGGGLFNVGTAMLIESSISNNSAPYGGAGIRNDTVLTMVRSIINANSTGNSGGGIYNSGSFTASNSTISSNQAAVDGGGIFNGYGFVNSPDATVNLNNVTLTNNAAETDSNGNGDGGGFYNVDTGTVTLQNTILAGNSGPDPDCSGVLTSNGYNLIRSTSGCSVIGDETGNLTGLNPNLGPLQNNGGLTFTHALLSNSPAIDAGNDATCESTDQRGVTRPQGAHCDIGAFEYQGASVPTATGTAGPTATLTPTTTLIPTFTSTSVPGGSTTSTFTAEADAYVRSPAPTVNYGTETTLRAYKGGSSETNSHVRFSVAGITGPVQSAKLRLYVTDTSTVGGGTLYQTIDNNWTETGINYSNQPATTGTALATLGAVSAGTWIEIDVSSAVTANGVYTFGLLGNSSDVAYYASRESLNQPQLVVRYASPDSSSTGTPTPTRTFTLTPTATDATPVPTFTASATPMPTTTQPSVTPTYTPTATKSPAPTSTASGSDVIFADSFESGNLSAWTSSSTDAGDLSVSSTAALTGSQGLQAVIDDNTAMYLTDDTPNAEPHYLARFHFDPNSISMANGDTHIILRGYSGSSTVALRLEFGYSASGYQIRAGLVNDGSTFTDTDWFPLTDAPHAIQVDWRSASSAGANNGGLVFWIDGVQQQLLTGIDNDTRRIDRIRLGANAGIDSGTRGTYYFDAFESQR